MVGKKGRSGRPVKSKQDRIDELKPKLPVKVLQAPVATVTTPPDWLSEGGKRHWNATVDKLQKVDGLLTEFDLDALACYCDSWDLYQTARAELKKSGMLEASVQHGTKPHPYEQIMNRALERIKWYQANMGFVMSSRAKIPSSDQPKQEATPTMRLLQLRRDGLGESA